MKKLNKKGTAIPWAVIGIFFLFIFIGIFGDAFPKFFLILLGIGFVIFFARIIPGVLLEVIFFGAIFSFFEAWRFWGTQLGIPGFEGGLMIFICSALIFWAIARFIYVIGMLWFPPAMAVSTAILGS